MEVLPAKGAQAGAPERLTARAKVLGSALRRSWSELVGLQEGAVVDADDLVTGSEARARVKLSKAAFRRWCERRGVAAYRLGVARAVRYRWSEIVAAVEACRNVTPVGQPPGPPAGG